MEERKPIDNVTVENLDMVLRMCHIEINKYLLDKIIDIIELIEDKGDMVTLQDVCDLQKEWNTL